MIPGDRATYQQIDQCRACGNKRLVPVLDLGFQCLTGIFPRSDADVVPTAPLQLVRCEEDGSGEGCGLVQLRHSTDPGQMYGANYGYRSSLNASMVAHLRLKALSLSGAAGLAPGDLVLDIGSNDGTLLSQYPMTGLALVGVDPTADRFARYYRSDITAVPEFFSAGLFRKRFRHRQAKLVTSIAMMYDLERPVEFMREVASILAPDGVWHFEQSYLPAMLSSCAYDTICHEHLEYYGFLQIRRMVGEAGLRVLDVSCNSVNGGSFAVTVTKDESSLSPNRAAIDALVASEEAAGLAGPAPYDRFRERVWRHRDDLVSLLKALRSSGKIVAGYGASTKGNVLLQFCGLGEAEIPFIADVNADKWGCSTPGTRIPIISESEARSRMPDYFLVLPWHFRENIIRRESEFLASGRGLIFPLPMIEIVRS